MINGKKVALVSMMNNDFLMAYEAFMKSFLFNNSWFDLDFIMIDLDLTKETKKICKSYYPKIQFSPPKKGNYNRVDFAKTPEVLKCTYYKLDTFSFDQYDRVVFIDMDTIVLGDINLLFLMKYPIAGCKGYNQTRDELRNDINTGVFVVNKPLINQEIYFALIKKARYGYSMPDQKAINLFFKPDQQFVLQYAPNYTGIVHLDKRFNCEKRMLKSKKYKVLFNECKILHFISQKPWEKNKNKTINNKGYESLEKMWWEWYKLPKEVVIK